MKTKRWLFYVLAEMPYRVSAAAIESWRRLAVNQPAAKGA